MTDRVTAWQCIGCGRIEAPQPCIGVCQDRKMQFVYAARHDEVLRRLQAARGQVKTLKALIRRMAMTTPRDGEWEQCYRALRSEARRVLAVLPDDDATHDTDALADRTAVPG